LRENIKFLTITKIIEMLKEDGLPASRDSLYYWEKTGKISAFRRTPGNWRYILFKDYEELFNIIAMGGLGKKND